MKKLKASFVAPSLAGKAHFATSMSGFGAIVRKKTTTTNSCSIAKHSPEEKSPSHEEEDNLATKKENRTEKSGKNCVSQSERHSDIQDFRGIPSTSANVNSEGLPNPFKSSIVDETKTNEKEKDSDDDDDDDDVGDDQDCKTLEKPLSNPLGVDNSTSSNSGNSLSLLSGVYDGSSSDNDSDT